MATYTLDSAVSAKTGKNTPCKYTMAKERLFHPDIGYYDSYGIQVNTPEDTFILHDISTCREEVGSMVILFNQHKLSPIHLHDVVSDML